MTWLRAATAAGLVVVGVVTGALSKKCIGLAQQVDGYRPGSRDRRGF